MNVTQAMKELRIFVLLLFFLGGVLTTTPGFAEPPKVVVSIHPLYFLVQDLMQGISKPELILSGTQSPHHYRIRPSQLRSINQADIVFWIGPSLESSLQKIINNLPKSIESYSLISSAGLHTLAFSKTGHSHNKHSHPDEPPDNIDPHIWLDNHNAIQMARAITEILIEHDPRNKESYQHNLNQLEKKLTELRNKISAELEPLKSTRLLALHDAWQYFANDFGLQGYKGIAADGLEHLGAQSFLRLKRNINKNKYECVIAGPETNYKKAQQLVAGSKARLIMLDPLGNDLPNNAGYEQFMLQISKSLQKCLKAK